MDQSGVAVFDQAFHHGVLMFADIDVSFEVPTALLAVLVHRILEFLPVPSHCGHVVSIVLSKVMERYRTRCKPYARHAFSERA